MREKSVPGENCVGNRPIFDKDKFFLPQLRIRLGLMKNFVKAVNIHDNGFEYLRKKIPKFWNVRLKEVIFIAPQILEIFNL